MKTLAQKEQLMANLQRDNEALRERLRLAEAKLQAIQGGGVDSPVAQTSDGPGVVSLVKPDTLDSRGRFYAERIAQLAATLVLALGALVLVGWLFDITILKSVSADMVSMKANTALAFLLASAGCFLATLDRAKPRLRPWRHAAALAVGAVGALTLVEWVFAVDLGIDQLLFQEAPGAVGTLYPGRMTPWTALNFVLFGAALLFLDFRRTIAHSISQSFAMLACLPAILSLVGYAVGRVELYGVGLNVHLALHTNVAFVLLAIGVLSARWERNSVRSASADYGIAFLAFTLVFLTRWALWPLLGTAHPFVLPWPAIIVAAWYGGFRAGFLTTLLTAVGATYFLLEPHQSLMLTKPEDQFAVPFFVLLGAGVSLLFESMWERERSRIAYQAEMRSFRAASLYHRSLIEASLDPLLTIGPDGSITDVNAATEKAIGKTRTELIGTQAAECFTDPLRARAAYEKTFREGSVRDVPLELRDPNAIPVLFNAAVYRDPFGNALGVVAVARDVSASKRAELAIRQLNAELTLFRTLLDKTNDAIEIIDPVTGMFLDVNEKACTSHGYTREEYLTLTVLDVEETLTAWPPPMPTEAERAAGFKIFEGRHRRKDGSTFPVEVNVNLVNLEQEFIVAVVRDTTERKQAEATLRASEERFRSITVNMLDMVAQTDAAGIFQYVTPSNQTILGWRPEEMVGQSTFAFLHPEDRDRVLAAFQLGLATGAPQRAEFRFRHADGHYLWLECVGNVVRDDIGQSYGTILASRDVTERKATEDALRRSESNLQRAQAVAHIGSWHLDIPRNELFWSAESYRIFGVSSGTALTYQTFLGIVHPDDRAFVNQAWTAAMKGAIYDIEHRIVVNGKTRVVREKAEIEFAASGAAIKGIGITQDITERKEAEAQMRLQSAALEAAANSIVITDRQGDITWVNRAYSKLTGYSADEVLGKNPRMLRSGKQDVTYYQNLWDTILAGKVWHDEIINRRKDGSLYTEEMTITPVSTKGGEITHFIAIKQDVTERKRTEEALRNSEERFALAVAGTSDGIWDWNLVTGELFLGSRWKAMLGYEDHEFENSFDAWEQHLHPDDHAATLAQLNEYLEGRSPTYQPEFRLRAKDGSYRWILARAAAVRDATGRPTRLTGSHTDITDRKIAEEVLRQNEERFRRITTNMLDLIIQLSPEGIYEYATPSTVSVTGYREEELIGHSLFPLLHPDDLPKAIAAIQLAMETGQPAGGEFRFRIANGEYVWFESIGTRLLDDQGRLCGILIASRDITKRKQAEAALLESEKHYRSLFENMLNGFAYCRMEFDSDRPCDFTYLQVNAAFDSLTGVKGVTGKKLSEVLPAVYETEPELLDLYGRVVRTGVPEKAEMYLKSMRMWFALSVFSAGGADFVAVFDVITERKEKEAEIRRLNAELEERVASRTAQLEAANKELEAFAYSVSHDLRAPLRGIDGFSQAILEDYGDKLDAEGQDHLRRVRAASQRMGRLIDDILQLSRMTRSAMNCETVDLSAIASHVVAELQATEPARHVEVCVTPGLSAEADHRLMDVVLMNLLGNAWKFTNKTENARIEFGAIEHAGQKAFFVRDNGAGFDMAYADRLFGAFQRLHKDSEFPGTGIGLATVQRIIRRHGGEIWAESEVNKGATFYFSLRPEGGSS